MVPEETSLINPSSLCKFRKLRLKDNDLMNLLIEKTVSLAVEKGIIKSKRKKTSSNSTRMPECLFVQPVIWPLEKHAKEKRVKESTVQWSIFFYVEKCRSCSRRKGCYKEGANTKSYSVQIKSEENKRQESFQNTEEFKEKARVRYKIEAKNAELKNVLGYDRATSYGMDCMRMQGALTIFVANLKRILKLS